jgi:hypothetical protein
MPAASAAFSAPRRRTELTSPLARTSPAASSDETPPAMSIRIHAKGLLPSGGTGGVAGAVDAVHECSLRSSARELLLGQLVQPSNRFRCLVCCLVAAVVVTVTLAVSPIAEPSLVAARKRGPTGGTVDAARRRRPPEPRPRGTSGGAVGRPTPYSGRGGWSPNRNDSRTKRRPAVTSRTSCRCEQLNSSAAPQAGRYSSGPYSGKRN